MPVLEIPGGAFAERYLGGGQSFAPVRGLGQGDGLDRGLPVSACIEPEQRHDGRPPRVGVENVGIVARGESLETRLEESSSPRYSSLRHALRRLHRGGQAGAESGRRIPRELRDRGRGDRKSTRLNSSHGY